MKGITRLFSNVQANMNNHSGLEATYLSKKYNLLYIGKKNRNNNNEKKYIDINNVDLNNFNKIFLQLSQPNFFGGVLSDDTFEKIKKISLYKNKLGILCNDPRIKPINAALVLYERFNVLSKKHVEGFESLLENATYLFPGKDLNKFYNDNKYDSFVYFDYFKKIFKNKIQQPKYIEQEKKFNIVYYGDKRGSYRENKLRKYMFNSLDNLLIGYKTNKIECTFIKKLKHEELLNKLNECKVSLILADKEHEDNVITFRFYETLASNCLAAIPIEYDPNKDLIQDKTLKDILYVEKKEDVLKLSKMYSKELIEKQHKEYLRHVAI
tara:strand:- start:2087 stop:3058 length:972 start_codon:yes stop_codon:yes gene_type:complete